MHNIINKNDLEKQKRIFYRTLTLFFNEYFLIQDILLKPLYYFLDNAFIIFLIYKYRYLKSNLLYEIILSYLENENFPKNKALKSFIINYFVPENKKQKYIKKLYKIDYLPNAKSIINTMAIALKEKKFNIVILLFL
ncbi:MAG: hypothetical protein KatS3mg129_1314 [Leptospiraceae bacterium]|nr:MAG: hypothetical protein KatS3mg129_1314 [Leptospiraceae bacterium]